jgi:signal transduction histidine kinase
VIVRRLPVVKGDGTLLAALFENLIANSIKFRSVEPPYIVIDAVEKDVSRRSSAVGSDEAGGDQSVFQFSVRDNGIGIDPVYGDRIFTMFQRLHSREQYGGTGIGLALCKRIVEHHGGRIWLEQPFGAEKRGTVISFTLPG